MLTKLTVRNFKRFEEVVIELGSPVVFIGPNNSGKTSAMQALALWNIGLKRWNGKRSAKSTPEKRPGVTVNRRDLVAIPIPDANLLWRAMHVRDVRRVNDRQTTSNIRIDLIVEGVTNDKAWTCGIEFDYANEESFYCRPHRHLLTLTPFLSVFYVFHKWVWSPIWSPYHYARSRTRIPLDLARIQNDQRTLSCRIGTLLGSSSAERGTGKPGRAVCAPMRSRVFGAMPVSEVTTANVLAILTPILAREVPDRRRVRRRICAVMKWAVAMGYRPDNPAGDALGQALGRQQTVVQHMRARCPTARWRTPSRPCEPPRPRSPPSGRSSSWC